MRAFRTAAAAGVDMTMTLGLLCACVLCGVAQQGGGQVELQSGENDFPAQARGSVTNFSESFGCAVVDFGSACEWPFEAFSCVWMEPPFSSLSSNQTVFPGKPCREHFDTSQLLPRHSLKF